MKKAFSVFLIYALVIMSLVPIVPSSSVQAQNNEKVVYQDGEYDLPVEIWKSDKDEISSANRFMQPIGKLFVNNGDYTVQLTLKDSNYWQSLQVQSGSDFIDVDIVDENEESKTRVVQFQVDNLNELLPAKAHIAVPDVYDMVHEVRFKFDVSKIPLAPKDEDQEGNNNGSENDSTEPSVIGLKEGNYTISFNVLHETEDKESSMARYMDKVAKVKVKNGKTLVTVTLTDHKTVTGFQIAGKQPLTTYVDERANTREETYEVDSLLTLMNARVQYKAETPWGIHEGDHGLRLAFDETSLQKAADEQNKAATFNLLENYIYTIAINALDQSSAAIVNKFFAPSVKAEVKDGKTYLTLKIKNQSDVKSVKVNGLLPKATSLNNEANIREETFELNALTTVITVEIEYVEDGMISFAKMLSANEFNATNENTKTAVFQLSLDPTTLTINSNNTDDDNNSNNPSNPGGNNGNNGNNNDIGNQPPSNGVDPKNLKDGLYTIDFTVLKDNSNQPSVMDGFVEKPAYLKVQNGTKYIAMTFTKSSYVLDFKVEQNGQLAAPQLLQVDAENDMRTVEFTVDDLYQKLNAWVHVNVPGFYNGDYDVQIVFDTDSIQPAEDDKEYPVKDPDADQKFKNIINNNTDDSLTFNRNDGTDGKGNGDNSSGVNPKTADKTKLFLFLSLLVASLIPLAIQIRKKLRSTNA